MALKDRIAEDINRVFLQMDHFAETHYWNGEEITCVPDEEEALKRKNNNYRSVFSSEYEQYIKNESEGLPRLNKVAREILFKYCTFSQKYRNALNINPQYKPLIDRWTILHGEKKRTLDLFARKILTQTDTLPQEVARQADFLKL